MVAAASPAGASVEASYDKSLVVGPAATALDQLQLVRHARDDLAGVSLGSLNGCISCLTPSLW